MSLEDALTQLEEGDLALHTRTGARAGRHLHAVADPGGEAGDQNREGGPVHGAVDVVPALVPQTPDLEEQG